MVAEVEGLAGHQSGFGRLQPRTLYANSWPDRLQVPMMYRLFCRWLGHHPGSVMSGRGAAGLLFGGLTLTLVLEDVESQPKTLWT